MKCSPISSLEQRSPADLLILPFWEGGRAAADSDACSQHFTFLIASGDFKAKLGEIAILYPEREKEGRILLLGLGREDQVSSETLRRAFAAGINFARTKRIKSINLQLPDVPEIDRKSLIRGVFEGIVLTNYAFLELKGENQETPNHVVERAGLIGLTQDDMPLLQKLAAICSTISWVRDWVNRNADDKTPSLIAAEVEALAKTPKLEVEVFDRRRLEKEKMGLILAVSRGSSHEPRLIQLSYRGDPQSKEHIVLVGKGVTFDTGGLSLKPTEGMLAMKCDMAGAAIVLGAVRTAALLDLKVNVTALAPMVENCIDGKSYKIGDVYSAYDGKKVEVNDADAEGRLILADALSYAAKTLKPTWMIDIATLTGAVIIALGQEIAGLFTSDERLAKELLEASTRTDEPLWRMPLNEDYRESLKSDLADLVNTAGRDGSSIKAALFLKEFVHGVPWAHIDAAGPVFLPKPKHYHPTKATGYGIRLLTTFLEMRSSRS